MYRKTRDLSGLLAVVIFMLLVGCDKEKEDPWSPYSFPTIDEIQVYSASGSPNSPYVWPTITGVVFECGQFHSTSSYIHDSTGGIRIYSDSLPEYELGDEVELMGEVYTGWFSEIGIYVQSYKVLSSENTVLPVPMTVSEAVSTFENIGEFVTIRGRVSDLNCNHGVDAFCFSDGSEVLRVHASPLSDVDISHLEVGDEYEITGVMTKVYFEKFLQPRFQSDLKKIAAPGEKRE